eukprot:6205339-Pleurochrysis_carterae.AAC.5
MTLEEQLQNPPVRVVHESITASSSMKLAWSEARRWLSFSHDDYTLATSRTCILQDFRRTAIRGTCISPLCSSAGLPSASTIDWTPTRSGRDVQEADSTLPLGRHDAHFHAIQGILAFCHPLFLIRVMRATANTNP